MVKGLKFWVSWLIESFYCNIYFITISIVITYFCYELVDSADPEHQIIFVEFLANVIRLNKYKLLSFYKSSKVISELLVKVCFNAYICHYTVKVKCYFLIGFCCLFSLR